MTAGSKPLEPDDPLALVGVALDAGPAAADEMARCLVEEFLREGWDEPRLMGLFRNPFYSALHMIYRQHGEEAVRALIVETAATWGVWQTTEKARAAGGSDDA